MHHLISILLTLLIFLTGGNLAVAKNQASSAPLGDLCALAVNSSSFPDLLGRRTGAPAKNKLGTLLSSETYQYDLRSQLTGYTGPTGSIGYGYDPAGNLAGAKSSTPGGYDISYDYDALNRITMVHRGQEGIDPSASELAAYNYDANGNLNGSGYVNGIQHSYTYNALNRLTNLNVARSVGVSPTSLLGYAYTLNKNGHRTQITELSGKIITNTYDATHRLTVESISRSVGVSPISSSEALGTLSYSYDSVGNRQTRTLTNATPALAALLPVQNQSFTVNDRLTTDTYDANGNTVRSAELQSTSSLNDTYSFDNRLIRRSTPAGKVIDITYNPDGHRISKFISQNGLMQSIRTYLTDSNNPTGYAQVIEERDPLAASGQELKKVHLYGHDLVSTEARNVSVPPTSPIYYSYDGLGSVRSITDTSGELLEAYDYDAYGTLIGLAKRNAASGLLEYTDFTTPANKPTSEFLFTGEQFDSDLNMYFLRARYLNTNTGRFHSQDTYEGRNGEPLTLHKYLYANGNPASYRDPSGKMTLGEVSATLGSITGFVARHALLINRAAIFTAEVAGVPTIGIGAGAWVAKEKGLGNLPFTFNQIFAAVGQLKKGRFVGLYKDLSPALSKLSGSGINQANHLNQVASFPGIGQGDGVAVSLSGSIASGLEHALFHSSMNGSWRAVKEAGRSMITNAEYDEFLRKALLNTDGFEIREIEGLVNIASIARKAAGYFDNGGLQPQIPLNISYP